MSRVRLRLSGATAFAAAIYGQLVGLAFSVIVARRLRPEDFGLWAYIGTMISYSLMPTSLIGGWISRDAAMGRKVMRPALYSSTFLIPLSVAIYVLFSSLTHMQIDADFTTLMIGLVILIPNVLVNISTAITGGIAPQYVGIGNMLFETVKLVLAAFTILALRLSSLPYVLLSVGIAHMVNAFFLLYSGRAASGSSDVREHLGRWLRGSVVNAVAIASGLIFSADVVLISILTGGTVATAYWQAALTVGFIVKASSNLIRGLYQRLLAGGDLNDVQKSLHFTLVLAAPTLFGSVLMADVVLRVINPVYSSAWPAAALMALSSFIGIFNNIYVALISGSERFDFNSVPSLRSYLRSRVALGVYVSSAIGPLYLALVAASLLITPDLPVEERVTAAAGAKAVTVLIQALLYRHLATKFTGFRIHLQEVLPYFAASSAMSVVVIFARRFLDLSRIEILPLLGGLGAVLAAAAATYFPLLYLISGRFRSLVRDVCVFFRQQRLRYL